MTKSFRSQQFDPPMAEIFGRRHLENHDGFTLIASENHPHPEDIAAMRDAQDAGFAGGYFEGYPAPAGRPLGSARYYQGCAEADALESLVRGRVVAALAPGMASVVEANVQPLSGAIANITAYGGILKFGDPIVSPSLTRGYGHLSHGADSPNIVSVLYDVKKNGYGVDLETGLIDYDEMEALAAKVNPKLIISGFSSYPREVDWKRIARIADNCGAVSMADISHPAGLVVAGLLDNPFQNGIDIVTTTTHKTLGGDKGAVIAYNAKSLLSNVKVDPEDLDDKRIKNGRYTGIDFSIFPGTLGGPDMCRIAAHGSTFRRAKTPEFVNVQHGTMANAKGIAAVLSSRGWPLATGGTDNHIILLSDVTKIRGIDAEKVPDGWEAAKILEGIGLVTNKNAVPGVAGTPVRPKGLRMGAAALATRKVPLPQAIKIAEIMDDALHYANEPAKLQKLRAELSDMAQAYPVPAYT